MTDIEEKHEVKHKHSPLRRGVSNTRRSADERDKDAFLSEQATLEQQLQLLQQSHHAIEKERDLYSDLFNCAPIGYFTMDQNGVIEEINHIACQILGLERHRLLGKSINTFLGHDEKEKFHTYLQQVTKSDSKRRIELHIRSWSGPEIDVCIESIADNSGGSNGRCRSVITDISVSKSIERELTKQRDVAERLIEIAPTIILVLDLEGKIVQVNNYFERLSGYLEHEIIGKDWISNFVPQYEQTRIHSVFSDSVNGIQSKGIINKILTIKGEERTIEWFNTDLTSAEGTLSGILAIGRDISEFVEAQELQRESEHYLHLISDALPVFIAHFDRNLRYISHNKYHQSWFDIPDDQINAKHIKDVIGEISFKILEPLIATVLSGKDVSEVTEMNLGNRGNCYFLVNFIPDITVENKVKGFFALMTDFTDIKNQEIEIKQRLMTLSRDSRLVILGEMVSEIAHELNQPLTVISNYCDASIRLRKAGKSHELEIDEILTEIQTQAIRASQIIQHIWQFTQQRKLQIEKIASTDLISEVVQLVADEFRDSDIEVDLNLSSGLPDIMVDRVLVQQVIVNLIDNAFDAMRDTYRPNRSLIIRSYLTTDNNIAIEVADTGTGLSEVAGKQLFDPFFTTKSKGMGLGLSISRSIIESHQGTLTARGNGAAGSIFKIELPV